MSDGMRRELAYLSSHATNRYFIPNWGNFTCLSKLFSLLKSKKIGMRPVFSDAYRFINSLHCMLNL